MRHTSGHYAKVDEVYVKAHHGEPMLRSAHLDLDASLGIQGDVNSRPESPRQVCIATRAGVDRYHVKPAGSRANIVLAADVGSISSGSLLTISDCAIRITFACEPCTHGARLAEAPMTDFRNIDRYLGFIVRGGRICEDDQVVITPLVFPWSPDTFRSRCAWALDFLPAARIVSSSEFLKAIGASSSYLRVLPRWMRAAQAAGKPVHRVLNSRLEPPSWAPDASRRLTREGLRPHDYQAALFPLSRALWSADVPGGTGSPDAAQHLTRMENLSAEGRGATCIPAP